jgi:stage V sporulation protein D (sporulation-specific penicillin-binding protein)
MSDDATKAKKKADAKQRAKEIQRRGLVVRTLILIAVCGIGAFLLLALRLYDIQVTNSGHYQTRALNSQLRHTTITATRGTIFDTNGKILAKSAFVENVFISPFEIMREEQDIGLIADGLAAILGVEREFILARAERTASQYQIIKRKVDSDEAGQVREFIREHRLRGVYLEPDSKRHYPNSNLASQILGFVGTDNIGLDGLEQRYDAFLTGVNGRVVRLTNERGSDLRFPEFGDFFDAQDGNDITLTIDMSVQYYVEKHLTQAIEDYDVLNGAMCIAMNPKTGQILAMAQRPSFDLNNVPRDNIQELFAHSKSIAVSNVYEPGSTFNGRPL